ncbi:MAG: DUF3102 domain-containing protein [Waterburya sp.]
MNSINNQDFDYKNLDPQAQILVKQKTAEIKGLIRQTAQDIIKVGQKLTEVKQQLKHGEFRNWLRTEFNWSISSATKFMQVSEQFKNVNFTHFNFATSALYILAAPSTPENAREYAIELASRGENITYSLAKLIVKHHKESADINSYYQNQQNLTKGTQAEIPAILEDQLVDLSQEDIAHKSEKSVRIVEIKQEQPKHIQDRIQDFEIMYAGTCVAVEGSPQDLTILFQRMQSDPQFAEDIFRQAKTLAE